MAWKQNGDAADQRWLRQAPYGDRVRAPQLGILRGDLAVDEGLEHACNDLPSAFGLPRFGHRRNLVENSRDVLWRQARAKALDQLLVGQRRERLCLERPLEHPVRVVVNGRSTDWRSRSTCEEARRN